MPNERMPNEQNTKPDVRELEELILSLSDKEVSISTNDKVNNLAGGLGDKITYGQALEQFGIDALVKGVLVELEHTDNIVLALEISIDHLVEDKRYYDFLEKMEKNLEKTR